MPTPRPATRPAHAVAHLIQTHRNTPFAGFFFFRVEDPANPLIARKWCDILPHFLHLLVSINRLPKIGWECVDGTRSFIIRHITLAYRGYDKLRRSHDRMHDIRNGFIRRIEYILFMLFFCSELLE